MESRDLKVAFREYYLTLNKQAPGSEIGEEWTKFWMQLLLRPSVKGHLRMNLNSVVVKQNEMDPQIRQEIEQEADKIAKDIFNDIHAPQEEIKRAIENAILKFSAGS
jgi:hypothetical protein